MAKLSPIWTERALSGCAEELRSGVATFGTSEKEFTIGAEGASRRWRWAMELIIVHLSDVASRSCARPASHIWLSLCPQPCVGTGYSLSKQKPRTCMSLTDSTAGAQRYTNYDDLKEKPAVCMIEHRCSPNTPVMSSVRVR